MTSQDYRGPCRLIHNLDSPLTNTISYNNAMSNSHIKTAHAWGVEQALNQAGYDSYDALVKEAEELGLIKEAVGQRQMARIQQAIANTPPASYPKTPAWDTIARHTSDPSHSYNADAFHNLFRPTPTQLFGRNHGPWDPASVPMDVLLERGRALKAKKKDARRARADLYHARKAESMYPGEYKEDARSAHSAMLDAERAVQNQQRALQWDYKQRAPLVDLEHAQILRTLRSGQHK